MTKAPTATKTIKAIRIGVDGTITHAELAVADDSCRASLCEAIGCSWIEYLAVRDGDGRPRVDAWLDEEGRIVDEPQANVLGSYLIARFMGLDVSGAAAFARLVRREPARLHFGNIVLTGSNAATGDTRSVPADVAASITQWGFEIG